MLKVASVTANVKFRASASGELQAWGRSSNVSDLVPLSVGLGYEENPTISYVPRQGVTMLRSMIMPITRVEEEGARAEYYLSLSNYADAHVDDVRAYLEVLGIEGHDVDGTEIILPFYLSAIQPAPDAVYVQTRSVLDWIRHAGSLIDVPTPHLEAGIVEPSPWTDTPIEERFITIRTSPERPSNTIVAVPFRDWWYYIDATDSRSKNSFRLIKLLVRLRLDQDDDEPQLPVLTVPVG